MSAICINISNLNSTWNPVVGKAQKCNNYIDNTKDLVQKVRNNLDYRIQSRDGIEGRLNAVNNSVNEICNQLNSVELFLKDSIAKYTTTEQRVTQLAIDYGLLEPKKKWYESEILPHNWDKEKWWNVGKAVVGFGVAAVALIGAIVSFPATGAIAIGFASVGVVIAVNQALSSAYDFIAALNGEYGLETNILKSVFQFTGGWIGSMCGNEDKGTAIGGGVFDFINLVSLLYSAGSALKSASMNGLKQTWDNVCDFVKGIPTKGSNAINAVRNSLSSGKEFLKKSLKSWPSFQKNILMPLWNQVKNTGQSIKTTLTSVNSQSIKNFFFEMEVTDVGCAESILGTIEFIMDPLSNSSIFSLSGIGAGTLLGVTDGAAGELADFLAELKDSDFNFFSKKDSEKQMV